VARLQHPGGAPQRVTGKKAHQIEQVYAQHDEILTSGAMVLFAVGIGKPETDLPDRRDRPLPE
jgi:hypothetical protein